MSRFRTPVPLDGAGVFCNTPFVGTVYCKKNTGRCWNEEKNRQQKGEQNPEILSICILIVFTISNTIWYISTIYTLTRAMDFNIYAVVFVHILFGVGTIYWGIYQETRDTVWGIIFDPIFIRHNDYQYLDHGASFRTRIVTATIPPLYRLWKFRRHYRRKLLVDKPKK